MQISIPRLTRPIPLTDYAPELVHDGQPIVVHVWVNPSGDWIESFETLRGEIRRLSEAAQNGISTDMQALAAVNAGLLQSWAELWSQHPDPATHWTPDEVMALEADRANPALPNWLRARSLELISAYREGQRKK